MAAPVRGTQTFVGVMSEVWRRPSLTALEIAWRWLPGLLLIIMLAIVADTFGIGIELHPETVRSIAALQSLSVFKPVVAVETVRGAFATLVPSTWHSVKVLLLQLFVWNAFAAFGRTLVLRRYDVGFHTNRFVLFLLGVIRSTFLLGAWVLWFRFIGFTARITITAPAGRHQDPSLVLFAAMLIGGTLLLYVLWAAVSWPLQLGPLLALRNNLGAIAALRAALKCTRELRSKLIETNLVLCIVRIALIVLAMVLSASPLAFQTVATAQFFQVWWAIAVLLYLAASDYFHVVRAASYLSLYRVYNSATAS